MEKQKWVFDSVNGRVVTEDDSINVFYTDKLTCPDEVVQEVVDIFNNSTQDCVIGSGGDVDIYLLDAPCSTEDRELIIQEISLNFYNNFV